MLFHLVLADTEFPNDNPSLSDPCGVLAFADAALVAEVEAVVVEVEAAEGVLEVASAQLVADVVAVEPVVTSDDVSQVETLPPASAENLIVGLPDEEASDIDDESDIEVVAQFDPVDFEIVEPQVSVEAAADAALEPFALFVRTLVAVAEEAGCARAAALLPALLDGEHVEEGALAESTIDALVVAGVLARAPSGLVAGDAFRRTSHAWRAILRGDSEDFSACGSRMLDEWAADLVARLVAAPSRTEQLRRQLRERGVAAFGLVMAA